MGKTVITLTTPSKEVTVGMEGDNLDYVEFMELLEMLMINAGYSKHEYESYVLDWASDIKAARNN